MVDIGGFFTKLKLISDKASFEGGKKDLASIAKMGASVGSSFLKIASATVIAAGAVSIFERQSLMSAKSAGLSIDAFNSWSSAASNLGVNADGLIQSIGGLDRKFQQLKLGQVDENLAKNLSFLGLGFTQVAGMKSEDRTKAIMGQALNMGDERKAAELVGQILGESGREFFYYMKLSGRSLNDILAEGKALTYTTEQSKKDAMVFAHEFSAVGNSFKSMGMYAFSQIAKQLTPIVTKFREWLMLHKQMISSGIDRFISRMASVFRTFLPMIHTGTEIFKGFLGLWKELPGEVQTAGKVFAMLTFGGPLGKLAALFLLIQDVVVFLQGGISVTGEFVKGIGKVFGFMHLDEDIQKGWNDFFDGLSKTVGDIAKNIKYVIDNLNQLPQTFKFATNQGEFKTGLTESAISNVAARNIAHEFLQSRTKYPGVGGAGFFESMLSQDNPNAAKNTQTFADIISMLEKASEKHIEIMSGSEAQSIMGNQNSVTTGNITFQLGGMEDKEHAAWLMKNLKISPQQSIMMVDILNKTMKGTFKK